MLTYQELIEKKLSQLNQQHVGTVKGLETAMHSQGIDPGEAKRDGHHVNYPKATFRKSGKPALGLTSVDDGKGKLTSSTGGKQIRDAVLKSGRVNKTPGAKAERAKVAAENKAKKAKNRDPFTREHSEWWLDMWRLDEAMDGEQEKARRLKQMNKNPQVTAANQRAQRNQSSKQRLADIESKATARAPERREQEQASKDRAVRNAASKQRVADASKNATLSNITSKGSRLGGTKQTMQSTSRIPNTIKKPQPQSKVSDSGITKSSDSKTSFAKARKERDITNKLDKEDKNKGRTWKDLRAVGKYVGKKALEVGKGSVTDGPGFSGPDSVQGSSEIIRGRRS